LREGVKARVEE